MGSRKRPVNRGCARARKEENAKENANVALPVRVWYKDRIVSLVSPITNQGEERHHA